MTHYFRKQKYLAFMFFFFIACISVLGCDGPENASDTPGTGTASFSIQWPENNPASQASEWNVFKESGTLTAADSAQFSLMAVNNCESAGEIDRGCEDGYNACSSFDYENPYDYIDRSSNRAVFDFCDCVFDGIFNGYAGETYDVSMEILVNGMTGDHGVYWAEDVNIGGILMQPYSTQQSACQDSDLTPDYSFMGDFIYFQSNGSVGYPYIRDDSYCDSLESTNRVTRLSYDVSQGGIHGYTINESDEIDNKSYWRIDIPEMRMDPNMVSGEDDIWVSICLQKGSAACCYETYIGKIPDCRSCAYRINSPNGGESLCAGSPYNISWTSTGADCGSDVTLQYSANAGTAWNDITGSTLNDGAYSWTIPSSISTYQARIRVIDNSNPSVFDQSDAVFIIKNCYESKNLSADAGPEQMVASGSRVTLTGSWSSSSGAVVDRYNWIKVSGPSVVLSGSDGMAPEATLEKNPTFTAPVIESGQTELVFQFIVKDSTGASDTDEVTITVVSQAYFNNNMPPVADAGPDKNVIPGTIVTLDGSRSSDPEGKLFSYKWTIASGPDSIILSDSTAVVPSFTAPYQSGAAVFHLVVTDDAGETDQDSVRINWTNAPPVADAGPAQSVLEKETVVLDGSGSFDPDDGISTYQWNKTSGPAVSLSDSAAAVPTFIAPSSGPDPVVLSFKLIVTDSIGRVSTDMVSITIYSQNEPPMANAGVDQRVNETSMVMLDGGGSADPDGDSLIYQWRQISGPAVSLSDAAIADPTFQAPSIGVSQATVIFELTVEDGTGQTATDRVEIAVADIGTSPIADAGDDISVYEKQIASLDGSGSRDSDGALSYLWTQISGPTAILSDVSAKSPTFSVPVVSSDSTVLEFRLMVEDNDGLIDMDEVSISVKNDDSVSVSNDCSARGISLIQINVLDSSGTLLSSASFPCSAGKGIVTDIPLGTNRTFRVSAQSNSGQEMYAGEINHVTIDAGANNVGHIKVRPVNNSNPLAEITSPSDNTSVGAGEVILFSGRGVDPEDGTLGHEVFVWTSSIDGPLKSGNMQFSTGALSAGTHKITLTVTDSAGASDTDSISITINATQVVPAPVITPEPPDLPPPSFSYPPTANAGGSVSGIVGQAVSFDGTGSKDSDGTITRYVWDFGDGSPKVNSAAPTHVYTSAGNYTVTLTVTDNDGEINSDTTTATINVIALNQPPAAKINGPFNDETFAAGEVIIFSGIGTDPEDGSLTGESLFWTSDLDGVLGTGTFFSKKDLSAGTHTITLTVADSSLMTDTDSILITITSGLPPADYANSLGMTFNYISPGTFMMGSPEYESGRNSSETQHLVTLTKGYYMQTTEVTQGQWQAVMGTTPSYFDDCGINCPVEKVSWNAAMSFIDELNRMEGTSTYRLPTEAEWEYAARAGRSTAFANGGITRTGCDDDVNLDAMGWYCYNSNSTTHPVAQKQANAWDLYDMHGNVWEWCSDWYDTYHTITETDPIGQLSGNTRVLRGGCWDDAASRCRSAYRGKATPATGNSGGGFRLIKEYQK